MQDDTSNSFVLCVIFPFLITRRLRVAAIRSHYMRRGALRGRIAVLAVVNPTVAKRIRIQGLTSDSHFGTGYPVQSVHSRIGELLLVSIKR